MLEWSLSQLATAVGGCRYGKDLCFQGVGIDGRSITPGALFVALKGARFDGHAFIGQARSRGAVAALVEQPCGEMPFIQVPDTLKALGRLAQMYRNRFQGPVVAVTGSCGKTTTKNMMAQILKQHYPVLATAHSYNNEVGLPLTLCQWSDHTAMVLEMGAGKPGDIDYLCRIARPTIAVITNAAAVHLDGMQDTQGVARTKGEIFYHLGAGETAVINRDDAFAAYWEGINPTCKKQYFGHGEAIHARDISYTAWGQPTFILQTPKGSCPIRLQCMGAHNIQNACAAAAVALALEMPLASIQAGLEETQPAPQRMQRIPLSSGMTLIDDTYNANPQAMMMAMAVLARCSGPKILVMGDMDALGSQAQKAHERMGHEARKYGLDGLYTTGKLTALTAKAFGGAAVHCHDMPGLIAALNLALKPGMSVLVKGSRSARMEQVVQALKEAWS